MLPRIRVPAEVQVMNLALLTLACTDALLPDRTPFPFRSAPSDYYTITAISHPPGFPRYEVRFADSVALAVADGSLREQRSYPVQTILSGRARCVPPDQGCLN